VWEEVSAIELKKRRRPELTMACLRWTTKDGRKTARLRAQQRLQYNNHKVLRSKTRRRDQDAALKKSHLLLLVRDNKK